MKQNLGLHQEAVDFGIQHGSMGMSLNWHMGRLQVGDQTLQQSETLVEENTKIGYWGLRWCWIDGEVDT